MKTVKYVLLAAFAFFLGNASAQQLAEIHISKGVPCAACHSENPPAKRVKTPKCQECHGDYAALAERTKDMKPNNVHANHLGDLECRDCHGVHKEQKVACAECHQFKFEMPAKK